jgi:putative oxidoreductase
LQFPDPARPVSGTFSRIWFAGLIELVLAPLLIVGLFTRTVAFILAGEMAFAYWLAHAPRGFYPSLNGDNLAIMYCFVFLYLAVAGGGPWSVDEALRRKGVQLPV